MHRRQVLKTVLTTTVGATFLRAGTLLAPEEVADASTIYVNPAKGANDNPGTKDRPLKALATAARRANDSTGDAATRICADWREQPARDLLGSWTTVARGGGVRG
ncbi:MAG TPA: hypothetical protein P5159_22980 [Phycisphaerae bacterium]|nr:hypothetical protein [Phycisphaerae bacterium]